MYFEVYVLECRRQNFKNKTLNMRLFLPIHWSWTIWIVLNEWIYFHCHYCSGSTPDMTWATVEMQWSLDDDGISAHVNTVSNGKHMHARTHRRSQGWFWKEGRVELWVDGMKCDVCVCVVFKESARSLTRLALKDKYWLLVQDTTEKKSFYKKTFPAPHVRSTLPESVPDPSVPLHTSVSKARALQNWSRRISVLLPGAFCRPLTVMHCNASEP